MPAPKGTAEEPRLQQSRFTGWASLLIMIGLACAMVSPLHAEVVSRVNYGVLFENQGQVDAVYDYWVHTYKIKIPKIHGIAEYQVACAARSSVLNKVCRKYQKAFQTIDTVRETFLIHLNESMTRIENILPEDPRVHSRSRSKRKVLGFISEIGHSLFGFATDKEIGRLAQHIQAMESKQTQISHTMAQFTDDLSSFVSISSNRYAHLRSAITENHREVFDLAQQIQTQVAADQIEIEMTVALIQEIYHVISLQTGLQDFLGGMHDLLKNKLSNHIIPYQDIVQVVGMINRKLDERQARLQVRDMSAREIYSTIPFVWTYKKPSLYVTIRFPLVASMSSLDVYKIYYFPVPINSTTRHATVLAETEQFIAFSKNQLYYGFPKEKMLTGKILDAQLHDFPLHQVVHSSCLSAIFFQNTHQIKEICDFRVMLDSVKPTVKHINQGQYLISNVTDLFFTCPDGRLRKPGCGFCLVQVPCLCDLASEHFYFPPRLGHCSNISDDPTTVHPINLAVLVHFYKQEQLLHLKANTIFNSTPMVNIPEIRVFSHNLSKIIADDRTTDLSLKRIAQSMKDEKQVFRSLADPVLDSLDDLQADDLFSWKVILTIVNSGLIVLLIAAAIFLFCKIRIMHMALLAVAVTPRVQSAGVHVIPTTTIPTTQMPVHVHAYDNTLLYVMIGMMTIALLFMIYKYLTRVERRAVIALEISNGHSCVIVPLIRIPHCPKFYHCQAGDNFGDMEINGWLKPLFVWDKGSLVITHLLDRSRPDVPERVPVSMIQGMKLRMMMKGTIYAYLIAEHGHHAFQLNICPLSCRSCCAKLNAVEAPASTSVEP